MERDADASEIIAKAYLGEPETAQTELSVKARVAAYAIESSRAIGWKLGPKDMRKAFNACERDRTGNPKAKDLDLSEDDEGCSASNTKGHPGYVRLHLALRQATDHPKPSLYHPSQFSAPYENEKGQP